MAKRIGWLLENIYRLFKISSEPKMTVFLAEQLAMSHYFSNARARRDLGYIPDISMEEGMELMIASLTKGKQTDD
jgi:nucleoside-diphosphate-sugar epimerase